VAQISYWTDTLPVMQQTRHEYNVPRLTQLFTLVGC